MCDTVRAIVIGSDLESFRICVNDSSDRSSMLQARAKFLLSQGTMQTRRHAHCGRRIEFKYVLDPHATGFWLAYLQCPIIYGE